MSVEVETRLKAIQAKLQQVLKQYAAVQRENWQLKKEIAGNKQQLAEQDEKIQALQQQSDIQKMGVSNWSDQEKLELEKRIDIYLKEIDKCIALLNN